MNTNPIAEVERPDSGWIVTPIEALLYKNTRKFFCPDYNCTDPSRILILKTSSLGTVFFSHRPGCGHDIYPQTLLHKLAVKWFTDKVEFEIPQYKSGTKTIPSQTLQIEPDKTQLEYNRLKIIIPDVILFSSKGFKFAIEIVVTNDISSGKQKLIEHFGLLTVRIDLSSFYKMFSEQCRTNKVFVEKCLDELLTDLSRKSWVVSPGFEHDLLDVVIDELPPVSVEVQTILPVNKIEKPPQRPLSDNTGCFIILPVSGLIWLLSWLANRRY